MPRSTATAKTKRKVVRVEEPPVIEEPMYESPLKKSKSCCDDCGQCENCLHPAGNIRNYTPLLMLLLLISSFLLGMLLTKLGYLQGDNLSGYTQPSTTGTQPQAQAGGAIKPLHVAQSIGMDANAFKKCLDSGKYTQQVATDLADGQKAGVTGTPAIFVDGISIVGAQPYSVFKQTIDQELASARLNNVDVFHTIARALAPQAFAQTPDTTTPTQAPRVDVGVGPFPVLGNSDAKVTIIEFADFQCPFCKQFYTQTESSIINDYVKTGKAKFAFRNYPFLGQESNTSAEGAYCAQDQGKFWAYHNFMYEHQGQENSGQFTKDNLE